MLGKNDAQEVHLCLNPRPTFSRFVRQWPVVGDAPIEYVLWDGVYIPGDEEITDEQIFKLHYSIQELHIILPQTVTFRAIKDNLKKAYVEYAETGDALCRNNCYEDILQLIEKSWSFSKSLLNDFNGETEAFNLPFLSLLLPSYSGKTEVSLALDSFSKYPLVPFKNMDLRAKGPEVHRLTAVINIVIGANKSNEQPIYESIDQFSSAFGQALHRDIDVLVTMTGVKLESIKADAYEEVINNYLAASRLCEVDREFATVGLILTLINARITGNDTFCLSEQISFQYKSTALSEGRLEVKRLCEEAPIVVTLDEFNIGASSPKRKLTMLLARNLLRELGLVVTLMGTDSAAANLVIPDALGDTSRGMESKMSWCYVVSELPPAQPSTLPLDLEPFKNRFRSAGEYSSFSSWITSQLPNGSYAICQNPGILKVFFESVFGTLERAKLKSFTALELLQSAIRSAGERIYADKISRKPDLLEVVAGQYSLVLPKKRLQQDLKHPAFLIHRHFAYLDIYGAAYMNINGQVLGGVYELFRTGLYELKVLDSAGKSSKFTPNSLLPEFMSNELLYMMLLDQETMSKFTNNSTFSDIARQGHEHSGFKGTGNSNATIKSFRNGCFLENLVQGSAVLATHGSCGGVIFGDFMNSFLSELENNDVETGRRHAKPITVAIPEDENLKEIWKNLIVPYTACVGSDAVCSEGFITIPGAYTGVFKQAANKEMIDGILSPWIVHQIVEHYRTCKVCSQHAPLDLSDYFKDPKLERHCRQMNGLLKKWKRRGILKEWHLGHLMRFLFEMKDYEKGLTASDFYDIVKRWDLNIRNCPLQVNYQICFLVAAKCDISDGKKFAEAVDLFKGSVYQLEGNRNNVVFKCFWKDDDPTRICFIIPAEDVLEADFDPFANKMSSAEYNLKRPLEREPEVDFASTSRKSIRHK